MDLLLRSHQQQRLAPAYLFSGPKGVGRRLAAERFAELILTNGNGVPAALRRRITQRNHPDLLWVEPTYLHRGQPVTPALATELGIRRKSPPQVRLSQVRDIGRFLSRPPLEASRAVVVIEAAETMAEGAANGLLKTLEEPGAASLILLAPGPQTLLPTLISRCQLVPFVRLGQEDMVQVLQQLNRSDVLQRPELLALAQGSPGLALQAAEQVQQMPKELLMAVQAPPKTLRQALEYGRNVAKALDTETQLWLADYLQQIYWRRYPERVGWLQALEQAKTHLGRYCQPRLVWEVTFITLWRG